MISATKDTRRFTRLDFQTSIVFHDAAGRSCGAMVNDVSYGGLRITMKRYLKPNTLLQIPVRAGEREITLPVKIVWCAPDDTSETFRAGLLADHRGEYTMSILSRWMLNAIQTEPVCTC